MELLLRSLSLRGEPTDSELYPYSVPIIRTFTGLTFTKSVTLLVGENGSGKSTLLEALACAAGSITIGSSSVETDPTLDHVRDLARQMRLVWSKKTRRGFFMRAEDFFGFARRMAQIRADMEEELKRVDHDYKDRSDYAKGLAKMPYAREIGDMRRAYGDGLDARSHGEAFLELFRQRFTGEGLYLMDEPEAPLSPMRQLELIVLLRLMVNEGAQFIIATHSPILLAYPEAAILSFDGQAISNVEYDELEHVSFTKSFLNNPEAYLRHLFRD